MKRYFIFMAFSVLMSVQLFAQSGQTFKDGRAEEIRFGVEARQP